MANSIHPKQEDEDAEEFGETFYANNGLFLTGKIDLSLANSFTSFVLQHPKDQKNFNIYLNSGGGDLDALCQIINGIKHLKKNNVKVNGIAIGEVCSAALFILLTCNKRYAFDNCSFMYHSIMAGSETSLVKDLKNYSDYYYSLNDRLRNDILVGVSKSDADKLACFFKRCESRGNYFFGVEDALKYGIIHKVIEKFL